MPNDYVVITRGGYGQWFTYDKRGRKGPLSKVPNEMIKHDAAYMTVTPYYEAEYSSEEGQVMYETDASFIEFKGKKIGPFQEVRGVNVTADKAKFYAIVSKNGKWHFMCSDGRDILLDGAPSKMITSPDGTKAMAACTPEVIGGDSGGAPQDLSQLAEYLGKMAASQSDYSSTTLYTIEGKKIGPIKEFNDFWFIADSSHWIYTAGNAVYYDGALLKKFTENIDKATFWIDDASHYAWVSIDKITFSDGGSYPYPVMMRFEKKGGKTSLCWVNVKQNGDVMVYGRAL
jgi:hypothetical protein